MRFFAKEDLPQKVWRGVVRFHFLPSFGWLLDLEGVSVGMYVIGYSFFPFSPLRRASWGREVLFLMAVLDIIDYDRIGEGAGCILSH